MKRQEFEIEELVGVVPATISRHYVDEYDIDGTPLLTIEDDKGDKYFFAYSKDCYATCHLEDVDGDLQDLIGEPITDSELVSSENTSDDDNFESNTWSFYKLSNSKISITLRFHGSSNGYYSETVDLQVERKGDKNE